MERDDIIIRNGVLHILDSNAGVPELSTETMDLTEETNEFLRGHIYRLLTSDDLKPCRFRNSSEVKKILKTFSENNIIEDSRKIAKKLYQIMNANIEIPSGDLFFITFQIESNIHLAILKINYKELYTHKVVEDDGKRVNDMLNQKVTLPKTGKITEAAIYCNGSIRVTEKRYPVNGEKINYFTYLFLECDSDPSEKQKMKTFDGVISNAISKYQLGPEKQMEVNDLLYHTMNEEGELEPQEFIDQVFQNHEIKSEVLENLEKNQVTKSIKPKAKETIKKYGEQHFITDNGIEISIPMEVYEDKEKIEITLNDDGTRTVIISGINNISVR